MASSGRHSVMQCHEVRSMYCRAHYQCRRLSWLVLALATACPRAALGFQVPSGRCPVSFSLPPPSGIHAPGRQDTAAHPSYPLVYDKMVSSFSSFRLRYRNAALFANLNRDHDFGIDRNKVESLFNRIEALNLDLARDVEEKFIRGSGAGGQKINKTSNNVQMIHLRIQTNCQRERFREKNRFLALRDLVEKLEVQRSGGSQKTKAEKAADKKRKQKARRRRKTSKKQSGQEGEDTEQELNSASDPDPERGLSEDLDPEDSDGSWEGDSGDSGVDTNQERLR